jgi:membrane dipeptidase
MAVETELIERARELHRSHAVVECHTDVPIDVRRRRRAGEQGALAVDYQQRFREGGVRVQLMATGGDVDDSHELDGGWCETARLMVADTLEEAAPGSGLRIVRSATDLDAAIAADEVGLVVHLEGARPFGDDPGRAEEFFRLGLRSLQLTWNGANAFADGVGVAEPRQLTPLGRELVGECDRLGVLLDVAHLAGPCFWDLVELARGPFICSHTMAYALTPHRRNLTDDQIRAIANSGGFVGVCFIPAFIGKPSTFERVLDHVDHMVGLVGIDAVGVGADYCEFALDLMAEPGQEDDYLGPEGLRRVETLWLFTAGLLERGYDEADAAKIMGGNAMRVLRQTLPS